MLNRIKKPIFISFLIMISTAVYGQPRTGISIPIEAIADSMIVRPKPMLILISTDWCKFCQIQKTQLKKNNEFKSASDQFYYAELNAESKKKITFNGEVYSYKSTGLSTGIHELAIKLGNKKGGVSYPTWVLLDQRYKILLRHNGVLSPQDLRLVLNAIEEINPEL